MRSAWLAVAVVLCGVGRAEDRFYKFAVEQDRVAGAPDFSYLNRPLTAADRVFVRGAHFYRVGKDLKPNTADDERVRFFGVNMAFGANFPEEGDAQRIAKRLRRLGVNLVRLHHMDTSPDSDPENARGILTTGPYPSLNPVAVKRLRTFLDALAAEGIYANLNLHVGYVFRPGVDGVPALPEGMRLPELGKPLHMLWPRMIELQTEFTRKLIAALKLKDDPVLAMVEVNNESSLVEAWQRGSLERYAVGEYGVELERRFGGRMVSIKDPADDRMDKWLVFLAGQDRAYLGKMLAAVRESTDALVPVAGTQMGFGGLLNLESHAEMSYQDNHFYIDHYNFPNQRWDARDWRIRDSSGAGTGFAAFVNMAAAREAGKPYTVSEFNENWPNTHAAEIDPALAAFAGLQDWDAIMHFAYEHGRNWDTQAPSGFNINGDWTKWVNLGQAAWLFRTGAVRPAAEVSIPVSRAAMLRAARERRGGNIAQALAAAIPSFDAEIGLAFRLAIAPAKQGVLRATAAADTAPEVRYLKERKLLTIAAPLAAGVIGFLGKDRADAGALSVELAPATRGFAAVMLTALDGKPLEESARMLLTIPGYTLGTLPGTEPARIQRLIPYPGTTDWWTLEPEPGSGKPSGRNGGSAPVWMERIESFVTIRTRALGLKVFPLDGAGARRAALPRGDVLRSRGAWRIHLQAEGQELAPWYEIEVD